MKYKPTKNVTKVERKRSNITGDIVTSLYTDTAKVRISAKNRKGHRQVCIHYRNEKLNEFSTDGHVYYSTKADRFFFTDDPIYMIIEDVDKGFISL